MDIQKALLGLLSRIAVQRGRLIKEGGLYSPKEGYLSRQDGKFTKFARPVKGDFMRKFDERQSTGPLTTSSTNNKGIASRRGFLHPGIETKFEIAH